MSQFSPTNGLGIEDLLLVQSTATVQQTRGNLTVPVTPINAHTIPYGNSDKTIAEMLDDTTTINEAFEAYKVEVASNRASDTTTINEALEAYKAEVASNRASDTTVINNNQILAHKELVGLRGLLEGNVSSIIKEMRDINTQRDIREVQIDSKLGRVEKLADVADEFSTHIGVLQRIDAGTRLDKVEPAVHNLKCKGVATTNVFKALVTAINNGTLSLVDGESKDELLVALNIAKDEQCQE